MRNTWLIVVAILAPVNAAVQTINVRTSTATVNSQALAKDFIAATTTQFDAQVVAGYFADSWTLTIKSRKGPPPPSLQVITLDTVTNKLVKISSDSYVYGYMDGMVTERNKDLDLIASYIVNCSSPSYFANSSTATWSPSACNVSLGNASNKIYTQFFSTPTVLPGF